MRNYGEELAFWYFRLNGFFPITDFVTHGCGQHNTSDIDILAVRFPFVFEEFGGQNDDWGHKLFSELNLKNGEILGVICEVKTGGNINPSNAFNDRKMKEAVRRLGFVEREKTDDSVEQLRKNGVVIIPPMYRIAKILVTDQPAIEQGSISYYHLSLNDIENFILHRMRKYHERKFKDRIFFSSSLLQYLIWKSHKENR